MSKRLIKLLPAAVALTLSGLANASISSHLESVTVKYGDLNLNTRTGVATLHARLKSAAKTVCGPLDIRVLGLRDEYDRCVSDAVKQSVAAVGNEELSRYHRNGGRFSFFASN